MGDKQSKGAAPAGEVGAAIVEAGTADVAAGAAAEVPSRVIEAQPSMEGENGGAQEPAMPSESEILAKLVAHLGSREDRRCPLAEVRAGLPPSLQRVAEDTQAMSQWLARFGGLITIVGEPGQEQIVLDLGGGIKAAPSAAATAPAVYAAPAPAAAAAPAPAAEQVDEGLAVQTGTDFADDEGLSACTVQLRGLPFRAQVNDIKGFLGDHAANLSTRDPAIRLLLNRDGRPSGFARVQFGFPEAAKAAREALHKQLMGDRYVEVLACSDRAGKARHRRAAAEAETAMEPAGAEYVLDSATEAVERERVLQECRDHMRIPGRQQLLLSMLGIALSPQARTYLRRLNLGLKHFLARFPGEFRVEGPKGCEQVIWCPNGMDALISGYPGFEAEAHAHAAMMSAWTAAAEMPAVAASNPLLASPTPQRTHGAHCMATPSDWGTPGTGQPVMQAIPDASGPLGGGGSASNELEHTNPYAAFANFAWPPPWAGAWPGGGWPPQDMGDLDGKGGEKGGRARAAAAGKAGGAKVETSAARSHAHLHPQSHPFAHKPPALGKESMAPGSNGTAPGNGATAEADGPNSNVAAVRLRGLPFSMSVQDVLAFFAQYDVADRIADGPQAAQLLPKANGRPSGQARVQMRTRYDAEVCQHALNNQWIGGRYIEVFVYGEEDEATANEANAQLGNGVPGVPGDANAQAWQRGGFQTFPPMGAGFPAGFPGPSPMQSPPPWAQMVPPATLPGAGGMPGAADGGPQLGSSLDTLFSFLYTDQAEGGSSTGPVGTSGASAGAEPAPAARLTQV